MITREQEEDVRPEGLDSEGIQSVDKALAILDALADRSGKYPMSLADLARRTGLHRSSVSRCLVSLVRAGYVQVDHETQRYLLGPKVLHLAGQFVQRSDVLTRVQPYLVRLRDATEETAFFSILSGDRRVLVAQVESRQGIRRTMDIGSSLPLHCSSASKAMLAYAPPDLVDQVLAGPIVGCGPGASTDPVEIRGQLAAIRERGYAVGRDEMVDGAGAVCAPVFNHESRVLGAIGIAGPGFRLGPERIESLADPVLEAARALSAELGYTGGSRWRGTRYESGEQR